MSGHFISLILSSAISSAKQGIHKELNVRTILQAIPVHVRQGDVAAGVAANQRRHEVRDVVDGDGVIAIHVTLGERAGVRST
jgi:hypothetical protein